MGNGIDVQADQHPGGGLVARVIGDAGVDQVDELDRELHLLTALKPRLVVLDLSGVAFLSSMGMGSLLRFRNEVATAGGRVALAALRKNVADAIRLAGIDRIMPTFASVTEALQAQPTSGERGATRRNA